MILYLLQISVPMSVEFEELAKTRENPTEADAQSKCFNRNKAMVISMVALV